MTLSKAAGAAPARPKRKSGSTAIGNTSSGDPSLSSTPAVGEPTPNSTYMVSIASAWNTVKEFLPEMLGACALPVRASDAETDGTLQGLTGFSEPWTQELYDEKYPTLTKHEGMDCALTLSSLDVLGSITPWIPFDEDRIRQLIPIIFDVPRQFPYKVVIPVDFGPNSGLPSTPMTHCMPPELLHALILTIADRTRDQSTWQKERKQWLRVVLSIPCSLVRMDKQDDRYSEALNKRTELFAVGIVTKLTVRQIIYNVYGFKLRKEKSGGSMSSEKIAAFYADHCKNAPGEQALTKTAIDQCLTILSRVFNSVRCEQIVADIEKLFGPPVKNTGLTLSLLQEIVYRCKSPAKIEWMLEYIWDGLCQKYLTLNDLTIANIKSQSRNSISDIALQQRKLREYLTGTWLDTMNLQSDAKSMLRDIFQSYTSYRRLYNPGVCEDPQNPVDRTFLLKWSQAAVEALNMFELAIVSDNAQIQYRIRESVRHGRDAADTLKLQPFSNSIDTIREFLNPTQSGTAKDDAGGSGSGNGDDQCRFEVSAKHTHVNPTQTSICFDGFKSTVIKTHSNKCQKKHSIMHNRVFLFFCQGFDPRRAQALCVFDLCGFAPLPQ